MGRRSKLAIRLTDGSGTISLKYVSVEVDRHGKERLYFRKKGKRIPILAKLGTPEFLAEYQGLFAGNPPPAPAPSGRAPLAPAPEKASFAWLVQDYYRSGEFKLFGARTRYVRTGILDSLCDRVGTLPYAQIEARHVRKLRDEKADVPGSANDRLKALRQLFKWAVETNLVRINPAAKVPYLSTASDGHHTWTVDEVAQFEERYPVGTKERLAMAVLLYLGVRRADAVRLGRHMECDDGRKIRFTENKGRERRPKLRELVILPPLREILDASPSDGEAYVTTAFGKPFTHAGFGNWFRQVCNDAGLTHCSAHGLRKAGATIAAENGATEHQLMAIFGWSSPKQAALYTRKVNRQRLADGAMHLIVPEQKGAEFVEPPSEQKAKGSTNRAKKRV